MNDNLIEDFTKYLFSTITGIDSNKFDKLGDYDKLYWIEMSANAIKHSATLAEYLNEKYNIIG